MARLHVYLLRQVAREDSMNYYYTLLAT